MCQPKPRKPWTYPGAFLEKYVKSMLICQQTRHKSIKYAQCLPSIGQPNVINSCQDLATSCSTTPSTRSEAAQTTFVLLSSFHSHLRYKSLTNQCFAHQLHIKYRSPIRNIVHLFAHQFAHQFHLLPYTLTNKSPHSSKVRSPIRSFVCSFRLTVNLTSLIQELEQSVYKYHLGQAKARPQLTHVPN